MNQFILGIEIKEFQNPDVLINPTKFPHLLFRKGYYVWETFFHYSGQEHFLKC